jgi:hypothetical protein
MMQAFSLQREFAIDKPRALPWAGMKQAVGLIFRRRPCSVHKS